MLFLLQHSSVPVGYTLLLRKLRYVAQWATSSCYGQRFGNDVGQQTVRSRICEHYMEISLPRRQLKYYAGKTVETSRATLTSSISQLFLNYLRLSPVILHSLKYSTIMVVLYYSTYAGILATWISIFYPYLIAF